MASEETAIVQSDAALPLKLLILPVRDKPLFPGVFSPLILHDSYSINIVEQAIKLDGLLGLLLTKEEEEDEKASLHESDLHTIGTAVKVVKRLRLSDGGIHIFLAAISRFRCFKLITRKGGFVAFVRYLNDEIDTAARKEIHALTRAIVTDMRQVMENNPLFNDELKLNMMNIDNPGKIADFIASILNIDRDTQQEILSLVKVKERMLRVLLCIKRELELLKIQRKITREINEKIEKSQREYFLREELKAIQQELGMPTDAKQSEYLRLSERFKEFQLSGEAAERVEQELEKFKLMDRSSPEFQVTHNYLDTVLSLPWRDSVPLDIDIEKARRILDRDHYKLNDVKERILEFIAVGKLRGSFRGSILCLVGPPGVGKTSVGRSVARALGKPFFRFSVGGMRDEAEIKGHRRTYIGAMPGKIIQGLKIVKENNPVFMIDEIDKLGISYQGDPSSALLEVLDPEQNKNFRDHYLDLPFDISRVLFITTANTRETIPTPLLNRMEDIQLSGYITEEKIHIAKRFLIPRSLKMMGMQRGDVNYTTETLRYIAHHWARESGLRNYEKAFHKIHRKLARKIVEQEKSPPFSINREEVDGYLGPPLFREEEFRAPERPGMVLGLAWTPLGGAVLTVEAIANRGKGGFNLTGQLGDVMQESAKIAYSYMRALTDEKVANDYFDTHHIHIHLPAGATKKDGPSAGITMATALLSLVLKRRVKKKLAMTGELSLVGDVLAIGGLKEKLIAAKRNNIRYIVFPQANQSDLDEIPDIIKRGMRFYPIRSMVELFAIVWSAKK